MQKRSEAAKQEKLLFRTKLKHTTLVVLCILFALSTIYAVDISTYQLVENDKDQYALRVVRQDENIIRVDFVGKRYDFDIQNIKAYTGKLSHAVKSSISYLRDKIR